MQRIRQRVGLISIFLELCMPVSIRFVMKLFKQKVVEQGGQPVADSPSLSVSQLMVYLNGFI